jgi:hypothetical protein
METQLTVRLPQDLSRELARVADRLQLKRADIVRMALAQYLREPGIAEDVAPYNKVKHLVGAIRSGISDLGTSHREHLVKRIKRNG